MTGDLLDGARAKRLLRRDGRWYLEVERLVAVDPGVFRPTLQRIEGREGILWFLTQHNSDSDLERSARGVFDTTSGPHATFESAKGTWVPSNTSARHFRDQARKRRAEVETYWRQQRELARLRVENDELKRRLAKLERILYSPGNLDLRLRGSEAPAGSAASPHIPPHGATPQPAEHAGSDQADLQSKASPASSDGVEGAEAAGSAAEDGGEGGAPEQAGEPASIPRQSRTSTPSRCRRRTLSSAASRPSWGATSSSSRRMEKPSTWRPSTAPSSWVTTTSCAA